MSEEGHSRKSINWGGLVKGIAAGAAVVAGMYLIHPGSVEGLGTFLKTLFTGNAETPAISEKTVENITAILKVVIGAIATYTGLSYLFSDKPENAERHAEHHHEAKESFAIREDMRKMQAVMMARMKAAGHQPAMEMAAQPSVAK